MEVIPHCNCLIYSKCGNISFPLKYIRSTIRTWLIRLLIAAPIKNIHFQNTKWKVKSFTALILLKNLYINQRSQLPKRSHYRCSCHVNMANSKTFLNISELLSKSQETSQKRGQEDSKRGCRRLLWNCLLHHMDLALKLTAAVLFFQKPCTRQIPHDFIRTAAGAHVASLNSESLWAVSGYWWGIDIFHSSLAADKMSKLH